MRSLLLILLVVGLAAVLLLTRPENYTEEVHLALPFTDQVWTGSVIAMLGGFFGSGLLLGYLAALPGWLGAGARARRAEKELAKAETLGTAARVQAAEARADARVAATEADEMQRLADEVARRTSAATPRDVPPRP